jgi:hypothetical protein
MSARRYAGVCTTITNGTNLTLLQICTTNTGSPSIRPEIYDLVIGSEATPGDQACKVDVARSTGQGTTPVAAIGPNALDPSYPTSLAIANMGAWGVEPAYTANSTLLRIDVNQRATFRWVAAPESGLIVPATQQNGLGIRSIASTAAYAMDVTALWME